MHPSRSQTGAVLFTALMFLIVVTLIALASIRSGVLELRMSLNDELSVNAFEQAQSLVDHVSATPAATPVVGGPTFKRCTLESSETDCDLMVPKEEVVFDNFLRNRINDVTAESGEYSVSVQRTGSADKPCPRGSGYSAKGTGCAPFRVRVRYDMSQQSGGNQEVNEGLLVLVSSKSGSNF
jgi:hypothetical protein